MKHRLEREKYLEEHELRGLLQAARQRATRKALRDYVLLALLANSAIRPGEALNLTVADLSLKDHSPWIRVRRLKKRREGGVIDDLPIARGLARTLARYVREAKLEPTARLFEMTVRNLELLFKHYLKLAGLPATYSPYALRHTALTRCWRESRDPKLVQELAGHASPVTTMIYTHVDPREKRRTLEETAAL